MTRLNETFQKLAKEQRNAFVSFLASGDPDYQTSLNILKKLPENGVDIIELGIPFLDPAGDGPIIEAASKRAIDKGMNLQKVLQMVQEFRKENQTTPIVLMGYYNPVLYYGIEAFVKAAKDSGADGLLIVDLPPEEDADLKKAADANNVDLIKLVTPTSDAARIKKIAQSATGFLYFVSVLGITGTKSSNFTDSKNHIAKIKQVSDLPVVIGFGIKEAQQAKEMTKVGAQGVVVGSALVDIIAKGVADKISNDDISKQVLQKAQEFANAVRK
ncbi:MAG: tryptophan synthase subunit alpha [Proteobacteria bacterium]|nr:tryptophan synthase subunit alpha [Pseudomonadota bacterium]